MIDVNELCFEIAGKALERPSMFYVGCRVYAHGGDKILCKLVFEGHPEIIQIYEWPYPTAHNLLDHIESIINRSVKLTLSAVRNAAGDVRPSLAAV